MKQYTEESIQTRIIHPKILYFGTPVVLLTTLTDDGSTNITPMSSAWALGNRIVLGLVEGSQGFTNLRRHGECVVNVPSPSLWEKVEALAPFTGANPIPVHKKGMYRHAKDKFAVSGLTRVQSRQVIPDRIAECPLQIEARVRDIRNTGDGTYFGIIEVEAEVVHAYERIILNDSHIDPAVWSPLIYNFRHYFGLGEELGKTFKAEV